MRIAITGAAGFIGSSLFERLARKKIAVAGLVRTSETRSAASARRMAQLEQLTKLYPNARLAACPDFVASKSFLADFLPTACVHLAGRSSVRESLENPGLYAQANGAALVEILEAARAVHCRRIVHASSVMVYGNDAPLPFTEQRIGSMPASFYGASKLAAEVLLNAWRTLHGMEAINLRLFSVYGPGLRRDSVPHLIASAIQNDKDFAVFGDGSSVRDYVEVEDVLNAIEIAVQARWSPNFPTAINIGAGVGTSLLELLRHLERALDKKARVVFKPAAPGELHAIVAGIGAAEGALGWTPRVELRAGIERFTRWFTRENAWS